MSDYDEVENVERFMREAKAFWLSLFSKAGVFLVILLIGYQLNVSEVIKDKSGGSLTAVSSEEPSYHTAKVER